MYIDQICRELMEDNYESDWNENIFQDVHEFEADPLYYHHKVTFNRLIRSTDKAYNFEYIHEGVLIKLWIACSLLRKFKEDTLTGYVHTRIFYQAIQEATEKSKR